MEDYRIENGTLIVGDEVEYILTESFGERLDIERIELSGSVRHIGGAAFAACENLKEVHFYDRKNLIAIDDGAFTLCTSLHDFDFCDSLETIGEMAFWECALEKVTLKENVKKIDDNAFWSNRHLREFNVLNPSCRIGKDVLGDCDSLKVGYIAPGYPDLADYNQADELIYTMLWLSASASHDEKTDERAKDFIRRQEMLIMEKILSSGNAPAMTGLVKTGLLNENDIDEYIRISSERKLLEITNLLLEAKKRKATGLKGFEL